MKIKLPFKLSLPLLIGLLVFVSSCSNILYIAPKKADCTGVGALKCYLIRHTTEGNWILHYQEIAGLDYEPGFSYKVKVKKETIKNPATDQSSFHYRIVEVLEKRDVTDDIVLEDLANKEWKLEFLKADGQQFGFEDQAPNITFSENGSVNGFSGCNRFSGKFTLAGRTIKFSDIGSTRMHCEESMDLETAFLKTLSLELRGLFSERKLILTANGENQLIFGFQQ